MRTALFSLQGRPAGPPFQPGAGLGSCLLGSHSVSPCLAPGREVSAAARVLNLVLGLFQSSLPGLPLDGR